jgi:hypothetical protein
VLLLKGLNRQILTALERIVSKQKKHGYRQGLMGAVTIFLIKSVPTTTALETGALLPFINYIRDEFVKAGLVAPRGADILLRGVSTPNMVWFELQRRPRGKYCIELSAF